MLMAQRVERIVKIQRKHPGEGGKTEMPAFMQLGQSSVNPPEDGWEGGWEDSVGDANAFSIQEILRRLYSGHLLRL